MALTNFSGSASEAFGGWLFEAAKSDYGRTTAFSLVVAASVAGRSQLLVRRPGT